MQKELNLEYSEWIIYLFQKIITSLACIEALTEQKTIKQVSKIILKDVILQYESFFIHRQVDKICLKYDFKDMKDFCRECHDKVDIFVFSEDLEHSYYELLEACHL